MCPHYCILTLPLFYLLYTYASVSYQGRVGGEICSTTSGSAFLSRTLLLLFGLEIRGLTVGLLSTLKRINYMKSALVLLINCDSSGLKTL